MARHLTGFVHVTNPDTGEGVAFGPDDKVPGWAKGLITNPTAWAGSGGDDEPDAEEKSSPETEAKVATAPKGNASAEVWGKHAVSLGIEVPDGASRDDIKALVAAAAEAKGQPDAEEKSSPETGE